MTHSTDWYIQQISDMSNKFGDKLLMLLEKYNVDKLKDITLEQAKEFYEDLVSHIKC